MRRAFVLAHRWVALAAGLLLALLGLTGSVMVWQSEIDAALNPQWFARAPSCAAAARPVAQVLALLAREAPDARPALVLAPQMPGSAYQVWERRDASTGRRREHFVDPDCGRYLGARERGAARLDRAHAVPLLYELHSKLLAGDAGHLVVGAGALVLCGLTLSGIVLAWPRGGGWAGWRRALGIKRGAARVRLWFDVHRAAGLWLAPLALLLSLTGAALVFDTQARALVAQLLPTERLPKMAASRTPKGLDHTSAAPADPDTLVAHALREFPAARWARLTLPAGPQAPAEVRLLQPGEPRVDTGATRVRLDASGQVIGRYDALRSPPGSRVLDWVFPLHSGEALGLVARLLWTAFGLLPTLLLATGAWLWWRRGAAARSRPSHPARPRGLSAG